MNFNLIPNNLDYELHERLNGQSLANIYPEGKQSQDPLPIYIISAHGICYQGVNIHRNQLSYSVEPCNNVFTNSGYAHNMFSPPDECYAIHGSVLGASLISSTHDNEFMRSLLAGRKTRQNEMIEPNYVSFARQRFSNADFNVENCLQAKHVEILFEDRVKMYNEIIEDLVYDLYNNVKRYNFRRKKQKVRIDKTKVKKQYQFPESMVFDKILKPKDKRQMKNYINRGKKLLRYAKSIIDAKKYRDNFTVFCEFEREIETYNKQFKKSLKTKPIISMPNIPTIEKYFDFTDKISTEKQSWNMGIVEIGPNTEDYLRQHSEIKFASRTDSIMNNTKAAQKTRIINNIHDNVLSGNCLHNKKSKTEWLKERINHTIDYPQTSQQLSLSEIMYQFGRGIYICINCSSLHVWNGKTISRFSKRNNPHYCMNSNETQKTDAISIKCPQNYISPKTIPIEVDKKTIDYNYLSIIDQSEIYAKIFNILVEYNENLYNYWPKNISVFPKHTHFSRFHMSIAPENYQVY